MYDDDEPPNFVKGDKSKGIHPRVSYSALEKYDPISRAKAREILEPRGFEIIDYEIIIREFVKEAKSKGRRALEAVLKEYDLESEYIQVPDLMFKGNNGLWGYLELEALTNQWYPDGEYKHPHNVRYPNRKHHFAENPKYKDRLWYCQFCYENMDLHLLFSFKAMGLTIPKVGWNYREPSGKEKFVVIPEGWYYENGLYTWSPDRRAID